MRVLRLVALLAMLIVVGSASAAGGLPGARAIKLCAAAGPYWPTMTLALARRLRVARVQGAVARHPREHDDGQDDEVVRLAAPVIAVASGFGSVWALDSGSDALSDQSRVATGSSNASTLRASAPYNIWIGGGSVWVADDQGAA